MNKSVLVLEKCLQLWEDRQFIHAIALRIRKAQGESVSIPTRGPVVHYAEFRNYLRQEVLEKDPRDDDRFGINNFGDELGSSEEYIMGMSAYGLASWVRSSRRIFKMERDLQLLLDSTSIEGVTMRDVRFPFPSFVIEFDQSFISDKGFTYSNALVIVEELDEEKVRIQFLLFGDDILSYQSFTAAEKAEVTKAISRNNWDRAHTLAVRLESRQRRTPGCGLTSRVISPDEELAATFQAMVEGVDMPPHCFTSAVRATVGMCLYLKSLPASTPHVSKWEPIERTPTARGTSVSDNAEVCSVASSFKLTSEEREAFSDPEGKPTRSFGEKCCHFRRGTWCRPPGSTENAPRTNWRRPTIVRKDKLKPGQLPKGAENILTLK